MVREIDGGGRHYRSCLHDRGINLDNYNGLFFKQNGLVDSDSASEEKLVLKRLASLPEFDDRSLRVTGVINTDGTDIHLILAPKDCPRLRESKYQTTGEMPNPNETFIVELWNRGNLSQYCKAPVLHSNPDEAILIAKRRFNTVSGIPKKYIEAKVELVTPEQWVEHWRYLILVKKEHCPNFVKRFADLEECVQQVERERSATLPSTVLR